MSSPQQQLQCWGGGGNTTLPFLDFFGNAPDEQHPARAWQQFELQSAASAWVAKAAADGEPAAQQSLPGSYGSPPDSFGIRPTLQLNTVPVSATFFPAAYAQGVVLYEPFGGLCAGLEAVLRNGFKVVQYLYSDNDPAAQQIALHRIRRLQTMYPSQLPTSAIEGCFSLLPMDVKEVGSAQLSQVVQLFPQQQWLVVGGWPCQDLSLAGNSKGMTGRRAQLLHNLVSIIGSLQQLMPALPPAYVLENVAFQHHRDPQIAQQDFA